MKKDWVTKEVYDGLVKAFEVLFCFREKAPIIARIRIISDN